MNCIYMDDWVDGAVIEDNVNYGGGSLCSKGDNRWVGGAHKHRTVLYDGLLRLIMDLAEREGGWLGQPTLKFAWEAAESSHRPREMEHAYRISMRFLSVARGDTDAPQEQRDEAYRRLQSILSLMNREDTDIVLRGLCAFKDHSSAAAEVARVGEGTRSLELLRPWLQSEDSTVRTAVVEAVLTVISRTLDKLEATGKRDNREPADIAAVLDEAAVAAQGSSSLSKRVAATQSACDRAATFLPLRERLQAVKEESEAMPLVRDLLELDVPVTVLAHDIGRTCGSPEAVKLVMPLLQSKDDIDFARAIRAFKRLIVRLRSRDPDAAKALAEALRGVRERASADRRLLTDLDITIKAAVKK
jgi:hypothetical protein